MSLAFAAVKANFSGMDTTTHSAHTEDHQPELAPDGAPLHIALAPGVLDQEYVVIRSDDDTDESYQSRCDLLAALLDYAKQQG
jgi:hypothetical protein